MNISPSDITVLLLFNLDTGWTREEQAGVLDLTSKFDTSLSSLGYSTLLIPVTSDDIDSSLAKYDPLEHIVFNWCESLPGVAHSEWLVAKYLEKRGFTFTGASSSAIVLNQDKCRMKQLLDHANIATPKWRIYNRAPSTVRWNTFPAIVKPSKEHCSEGIDRNSVVTNEAELNERIRYILEKYRQPVLVEEFIDGRELHISLWNNGEMLPPAEMEFSLLKDARDRICSYEAKYVPGSELYENIKTVLPASLNIEELRKVEEVCRAAYLLSGCRDYARIDMRMKDDVFYILDINPNADISPDTSTIAAAEYTGYTYGEFIGRIIQFAVQRHPVRGKSVTADDLEGAFNNLDKA
jgi:D-alanine-D-alanine ligase